MTHSRAIASFAAAGVLWTLAPVVVQADSLLYDNGADNQNLSKIDTINSFAQVSDEFVLGSSATLDRVVFAEDALLGGLCGGTACMGIPIPQSVHWCIGTTAFGTNVACGTATVTPTATGVSSSGSPLITNYRSAFSLPNLSLTAATYFLTLGNAANTDGSRNDYWGTTGAATSGDAEITCCGSTGIRGTNNEPSFQIYGDAGSSGGGGTGVPEPQTLLLLTSGLFSLAFSLRRSRHTQSSACRRFRTRLS